MTKPHSPNFIVLTALAVLCLSITHIHFSPANEFLKTYAESSGFLLKSNYLDLNYWYITRSFARILGVVFLAFLAVHIGFLKMIKIISVLYLAMTAIFALMIQLNWQIDQMTEGFYVAKFLYSFLHPVVQVFPCVYLFQIYNRNSHYLISSYLIAGIYLGQLISESSIDFVTGNFNALLALVFTTTTFAWLIFHYIKKHAPPVNDTFATLDSISFRKKVLSLSLGAAAASIILFNDFYLRSFITDIAVIDANFDFYRSLYFGIFVFLLFPAGLLHRHFGFVNIALVSLGMLFLMTIFATRTNFSPWFYYTHQIFYAIISPIFFAPLFTVLYEKSVQKAYMNVIYFILGFNFFVLFAALEKELSHPYQWKNLGWCTFSGAIGLCFLVVWKYRDLIKEKKTTTTSH